MTECGIVTQEIGDLSVNRDNVIAVVQSIKFNLTVSSQGGSSRDIKFGLYIRHFDDPVISKITSTSFFSIFEGRPNALQNELLFTTNDNNIRFLTGDILGVYIEGCRQNGGNYGLDRISVNIKYYTICD